MNLFYLAHIDHTQEMEMRQFGAIMRQFGLQITHAILFDYQILGSKNIVYEKD